MKQNKLSKQAVEMLEENGYQFKQKEPKILFKRAPGIMGSIVIMIITLFVSIPIFSAGALYGIGFILVVLAIVVINRLYFAERSSFLINHEKNTFSAKLGTYYEEDQPLSMVTSIILHSQFVDQYVTAARNSVEEHLVTITLQLMTKEELTIFRLKSEQSEPTAEIDELYKFLESSVKTS